MAGLAQVRPFELLGARWPEELVGLMRLSVVRLRRTSGGPKLRWGLTWALTPVILDLFGPQAATGAKTEVGTEREWDQHKWAA